MKAPERVSFNGANEASARDRSQHYEQTSHRETELEPKVAYVYRNVVEMYNELRSHTTDEISRGMGVDPVTLVDKDKKIDLETYVGGLKFLISRLLKYHGSLRDIDDRKKERNNLAFGSEELIPILEGDLRSALREQEKLRLLLDTAHLKIKHIEKKNDELLNQRKKVMSDTQTEKNRLRTQLRSQNDQLKLLQEENIVIKRPATGSSTVKKFRDIKNMRDNGTKDMPGRGSFDGMNTVKSANSLFNGDIKQISTQMDQNKLHNLQTKHELKEFRRKAEQEREKEVSTKQKDLLIARLNIQVEERDRDILRLKNDYDKIFQELKKMKEKDADREREEWNKEVLSDKNPHFIEHFNKRLQKQEAKITFLKKQLRKYAISEKKVFIKEKAFELERAEYQDRMIYLQDRVTKLSKITDDFRKTKDDGMTKDRYRKKRDNALNKSQTSSDEETRYGGGVNETMGTLATLPDSYGKTPKVAFESKLGSSRNQKLFH